MLMRRMVLSAVLTAALMAGSGSAQAVGTDDVTALKEQVAQLQNRIVELEKQLGQKAPSRLPMSPMDAMDPSAQIDAIQRQVQMMMNMSPRHLMGKGRDAGFAAEYDIKATDKAYIIAFDMPGMDKAKINVEVKDGSLVVSGERSTETKEDQGGQVYRQERSFGYFSRMIPLPEDAMPESVQAKYDNGVLTLTVDKKEDQKKVPAKQKIEVK